MSSPSSAGGSHDASRCVTLSIVALFLFGSRTAAADDVVDALLSVPGLTILNDQPVATGLRLFVLSYEQRVNHQVLAKGTFAQRMTLLHRSFMAPMIVTTDGYELPPVPSRSEPALIVDGNDLRIEHRFFLPSRPEPADWTDLTIAQAAADHHSIIVALKAVYSGHWLTTGRSKGGMAAVYHRRFYPNDVNGTIGTSRRTT